MEPEGSLPHSEKLTTCPYPGPDQSDPYPLVNFNPLTPNDLKRRRSVSPLKIKIPVKICVKKPTNTPIIDSVY
jgi:hypothetical protein